MGKVQLSLRSMRPSAIASVALAGLLLLNGCGGGGDDGSDSPSNDDAFEIEGRIPVPGTIQGAAIAPFSDTAYVSTGTAIIELDLVNLMATRSLFVAGENQSVTLSDLDATGERALVFNFTGATVVSLSDGARSPTVGGGSAGPSVFANDKIYTPSFNGRGVVVAETDGTNEELILPFPPSAGVAGPNLAVATPDETRVIFDDEFNDAIHVVDTATDRVISSISVGFDPHYVVAVDSSRAIVFVDGAYVAVDLSSPEAVPVLEELEILSGQVVVAPGPRRDEVVVFDFNDQEETSELRLAVLDTSTGSVKANQVLEIRETIQSLPSLAVSADGSRIVLGIGPSAYVLRPSPGILSEG